MHQAYILNLKLCLFTNYAIYAYGQGWDKQGQSGTKWGQPGTIKGTSRGIQGQAGPGRDKLGQGIFFVPDYPLLALLVPVCPCWFFSLFLPITTMSLIVPASLWLSSFLPTCRIIADHYGSCVSQAIFMSIRIFAVVTLIYQHWLLYILVFFKLLQFIVLIIAQVTLGQWYLTVTFFVFIVGDIAGGGSGTVGVGERWQMTSDWWHVTGDRRQMTGDMWQGTGDRWSDLLNVTSITSSGGVIFF